MTKSTNAGQEVTGGRMVVSSVEDCRGGNWSMNKAVKRSVADDSHVRKVSESFINHGRTKNGDFKLLTNEDLRD